MQYTLVESDDRGDVLCDRVWIAAWHSVEAQLLARRGLWRALRGWILALAVNVIVVGQAWAWFALVPRSGALPPAQPTTMEALAFVDLLFFGFFGAFPLLVLFIGIWGTITDFREAGQEVATRRRQARRPLEDVDHRALTA